MFSFNIDYKSTSTDLCRIGSKYDTDKSSQRQNVGTQHCHPYTIFYDALFQKCKDQPLRIAELGILKGSSLLMWQEYFPNSKIYGFDNNQEFINQFRKNHGENIPLLNLDVKKEESIRSTFKDLDLFDLIIEDTTHQFDDQIRVIENLSSSLKPGGMLIIEDVLKSYREEDYLQRLKPILDQFQKYYFVSLNHQRKYSGKFNNDKLFVLIKKGPPIFTHQQKITIITPSIRPNNLLKVKESINFDYLHQWIIVYDGKKIKENPKLFPDESKIKEYLHQSPGNSGNPQRNFALNLLEEGYIYYLDDDNLVHPDLYKLLEIINLGKMYTFNQPERRGDRLEVNFIDTAMVLIDYKLCKNIRWNLDEYNADGIYINECYSKNKDQWIYVNNVLSYFNKLK